MAETSTTNTKLIPVLVILLIVASFFIGSLYTRVNLLEKGGITGAAAGTGATGDTAGAAQPQAPTGPVTAEIDVTGVAFKGNPDAKVAIVEFMDYECPFCGQLFSTTFPDIQKNYIDTGKVKYYVKDFPLTQIHPNAQKSAEASHCARDQGKYWEYHDVLFNNQKALTDPDLRKYASDLGLNTATFNSCLDSGKYAQFVTDSLNEGTKYGVRGTPSSWIGVIEGNKVKGTEVSGAQPFSSFQAEIDKALGS